MIQDDLVTKVKSYLGLVGYYMELFRISLKFE